MALKVAILLPLCAALKVSTGPPAREMAPTLPKAMEMAGIGLETGGQICDPAGFATFSDESLTWFRACELKHSLVVDCAWEGDVQLINNPARRREHRYAG